MRRGTKVSQDLAEEAIDEYRRFVYLTQVADRPLDLPAQLDAVWHLHLTLTRDYWDRFCGGIWGCKLHHSPGQGVFNEHPDYAVTRELYNAEFGFWPPYEQWPTSARKAPDTIFLGFALVAGLIGFVAKEPVAIYIVLVLVLVLVGLYGLSCWVWLPFFDLADLV